jgi:hypothetical protein
MYFEDSDEVRRIMLMTKTTTRRSFSKLEMLRKLRQRSRTDDNDNDNNEKAMLLVARRAYELG